MLNFDEETHAGKKNVKAAILWAGKEMVTPGYYEIAIAFLQHYRCCLGLDNTEGMFFLQLMRYRSLSLRRAKKLQDNVDADGNPMAPIPKILELGVAFVGKRQLALSLDVTEEYVRMLTKRLVDRNLLNRIERRRRGKSLTNLWDVRPMLAELSAHLVRHAEDWPKAERRFLPCPCHRRRAAIEAELSLPDLAEFDTLIE